MKRKKQKGAGWALPVGFSLLGNLLLLFLICSVSGRVSLKSDVFDVTHSGSCVFVVSREKGHSSENRVLREAKAVSRAVPETAGIVKTPVRRTPLHSSLSSSGRDFKNPFMPEGRKAPSSPVSSGIEEASDSGEGRLPALQGNEDTEGSPGGGGLEKGMGSLGGSDPAGIPGPAENGGGGMVTASYGGKKTAGESHAPFVLDRCDPPYPPEAREEGIEGTTVLEILLSASGQIKRVATYASSGDRRLDRAAEEAVRRWRFSPRLHEGAPQEASLRIQVSFQLE